MSEELTDLKNETLPIDPEDPKYERLLANLQGNILKSHGRNHAVHLFLTFPEDADKIGAVRDWIASFAARYITSAMRQHYETKEFKINQVSGRIFGGFYLSAEGYKALGFTSEELDKFKEENLQDETKDERDGLSNIEISFKDGMAAGQMELRDLPRTQWEDNFRNHQIDALVLLADMDEDRLKDVTGLVSRKLEDLEISFFRQDGDVLRDKESKGSIEHFGFRDGISQPVFYQADVKEARANGYRNWDSFAPLELVLVKDPLIEDKNCFGSYLVYRKLEQNVKGFNDKKDELIGKLNFKDDEKERAGALIVGRFQNGMPVMLSDTPQHKDLSPVHNNFNYVDLNTGSYTDNKCPYHGHIRRMNPRGESESIEKEAMRRIVRRGITYGDRTDNDKNVVPTENVGLLFMCFQSSIPKQFGFIQTKWANTSAFLGKEMRGLDPIVGRNESIAPDSSEREQKWCPVWGEEYSRSFEFKSFVTLKGGEFFFAPSIAFLRNLAEKKP
jgi:Dyp-type peroxidase family